MTFILPSFGASAISAVPASGGGGGSAIQNDFSLSFDGTNSWLDIGDISSLTGSQANLSLSYWVKETSSTAHQGHLGSEGSTLGAIIFFAGNWYFYNWKTGSEDLVVSRPTTGVWHSVIVTMNNSYQKLFVDGVLRYYNTASGSTLSTLYNDFNVGKDRNNVYANAKIDEVALYQSTLSDGGVTSTGTTATGDVADIYNSGVPTDLTSYSPVGWWRMGDNDSGTGTTVTDQGSGGNDGTLTNSPTFSIDAPPPLTNTYSLSLDAVDDYATTPTSVLNFYNTGGSVSAWIKPSSVTGTQTAPHLNRSIISKANVYFGLNINEAGYPIIYFYDGAVREIVATTQVSTSSWMHICATWSTTGSAIYVNGTSEATSSNTPADIDSGQTAGNVYIGRTQNTSSDHFGGLIDELAVFNTELSSSDVTSIYNSGTPDDISSFSPVNWWRMGDNDSGTGTTITDQGSGGNDATLTNGPTFSTDAP